MKIQPITAKISYGLKEKIDKKEGIGGKLSVVPDDNITLKRDEAIIKYIDQLEHRDSFNQMISLASLGLVAIFLPIALFRKKGTGGIFDANYGNVVSTKFHSLANYKNIPTLSNCKSINSKLRDFLEKQVALTKASKEDLQKMGLEQASNKLLLYGPAGTGKSYFAKIFAKTLNADYMEITYGDMNSRFTGDHIENIKNVFQDIIQTAKKNKDKRFVVTFNEIDAIIVPHQGLIESGGGHITFKKEERNLFLNCIDKVAEETPNVTIIGTTNSAANKKILDEAAMSRFGAKIKVDYPDTKCLYEAIKANFANIENGKFIQENDDNIQKFAERLYIRRASFRNLDDIILNARQYQLSKYLETKDTKFRFEYLNKAEAGFEVTDGEAAGVVKPL